MLADYPIGFYMYPVYACTRVLLLVGMRLCRSSNNDNKELYTCSKCVVCVYMNNRLALLLHIIRVSPLYIYLPNVHLVCIVTQCSWPHIESLAYSPALIGLIGLRPTSCVRAASSLLLFKLGSCKSLPGSALLY